MEVDRQRHWENAILKWLYRLREIDLHGQLAVVEEDKLRIRGAIEE
jgi:hypothetical protein